MNCTCYVDGSFNLERKKKAFGSFVILDDKERVIANQIFILPSATINEAEYESLLYLLNHIINIQNYEQNFYTIYSDSQLLVNQLKQIWNIKSPNLIKFHKTITSLLSKLGNVDLIWTPRKNVVKYLGH